MKPDLPYYTFKQFPKEVDEPTWWWFYVQYQNITLKEVKLLYKEAVTQPKTYIKKGSEELKQQLQKMQFLSKQAFSEKLTLSNFTYTVYCMTTAYMNAPREWIIDLPPYPYALESHAKNKKEITQLQEIKEALTKKVKKSDEIWHKLQQHFYHNLNKINTEDEISKKYINDVKKRISYKKTSTEKHKQWKTYINNAFLGLTYAYPGANRLRNPVTKPDKIRIFKKLKSRKQAIGVSPGIAQGTVIQAATLKEAQDKIDTIKGPILHTIHTSPKWMPILKKVKGIITESGGTLSHAAIVSRELNIPCIVGIPMLRLTDTMKIIMNGETGKIIIDGKKQKGQKK